MSRIEQKDLVLHPTPNVDPARWDEAKYYAFVDELCRGREYQKTAIFAALRFVLGGNYDNLRALARENYDSNSNLREYYRTWDAMESRLQLPDILSCSLDLATGTGKSYVLYALAAIMLAEGAAKRVMVLCPSLTIERGLMEKFRHLAGDSNLRELMPENAEFSPPRIIDASHTVEVGCICVENYHAVLRHVRSSIRDSFASRGDDTLVLNDEAHHVASSPGDRGKWKEFLMDSEYGFRRVIGVSGTCYVGNEYFSDVVSRYSLREAIEERSVKNVEYVTDAPHFPDPDEKWQPIYQNHKESAAALRRRGIRPLSIVVTKDISRCDIVANELRAFLCGQEGISEEQAAEKVLVVTSAVAHRHNVPQLRNVDSPQGKVEWIVSVSMLSEGWDVKNVFQIVPHEERAFNSKLLVAQVLGRGLRVPDGWNGEQPMVTVFNHANWSSRIRHLVDEILEIERRVSSVIISESPHHFDLHNLEYDCVPKETIHQMEKGYNLRDMKITLPFDKAEQPATVEYERVQGEGREQHAVIHRKNYTAEEIAAGILMLLESEDRETAADPNPRRRTKYAVECPLDFLREKVHESVNSAGIDPAAIPETTKQRILQSFNIIKRRASKRVTYDRSPKEMFVKNTRHRQAYSCSATELRRDKTIFCRSNCADYLPQEQREFFAQLADLDGEFSGRVQFIQNDYMCKSPVNLAIADHAPERRFIRRLMERENADVIAGWLKNSDAGFYAIEYSWGAGHRPGRTSHTKRGHFSPDFFIKMISGRILVVEIKDDSEIREPSRENIGKFQFASEHFQILNKRLEDQGESVRYQFNMLTPRDYDLFFASWKDANSEKYKSELDAILVKMASNGNK